MLQTVFTDNSGLQCGYGKTQSMLLFIFESPKTGKGEHEWSPCLQSLLGTMRPVFIPG